MFVERVDTNFFIRAELHEYCYNCFTLFIVSSILEILYFDIEFFYLTCRPLRKILLVALYLKSEEGKGTISFTRKTLEFDVGVSSRAFLVPKISSGMSETIKFSIMYRHLSLLPAPKTEIVKITVEAGERGSEG